MRSYLTNLMAIWLVMQAMTGWCCRRPCLEEAHQVELVAQKTACRCHECGDTTSHPQPAKPCSCNECHGFCTYVPPEKFPAETLQVSPGFDVLAVSPATITAQTLSADWFVTHCQYSPTPPPLKLHLLHQILVI